MNDVRHIGHTDDDAPRKRSSPWGYFACLALIFAGWLFMARGEAFWLATIFWGAMVFMVAFGAWAERSPITHRRMTVRVIGNTTAMGYTDAYSDAMAPYPAVNVEVLRQDADMGFPRFDTVPLSWFGTAQPRGEYEVCL